MSIQELTLPEGFRWGAQNGDYVEIYYEDEPIGSFGGVQYKVCPPDEAQEMLDHCVMNAYHAFVTMQRFRKVAETDEPYVICPYALRDDADVEGGKLITNTHQYRAYTPADNDVFLTPHRRTSMALTPQLASLISQGAEVFAVSHSNQDHFLPIAYMLSLKTTANAVNFAMVFPYHEDYDVRAAK